VTLELEREEEAAPQEPERRRRRIATTAMVTLVGAMLAAGISGVNLVYQLWPSLKPDPKATVGATIESLTIDKNVTAEDFLVRPGTRLPDGVSPDRNGNVFYIRASIEGFKRSDVQLRWYTYDANVPARLPGLRSNDRETPVFQPQAPVDAQIAQVWVPTPKQARPIFVRFELWAGTVLLAYVDSAVIDFVDI
jgi:hypothetical protein